MMYVWDGAHLVARPHVPRAAAAGVVDDATRRPQPTPARPHAVSRSVRAVTVTAAATHPAWTKRAGCPRNPAARRVTQLGTRTYVHDRKQVTLVCVVVFASPAGEGICHGRRARGGAS